MVARLITPKTKLIILNSPSNPSGAVMSPEDMTEVVRLAHERGIWVISDECYVYLNYTGKNFSVGSLREYRDRFMVVGSLSKTYAMTGWRLGYTLGPAPVVSAVQKLQSQSTSNPTSIVQKAAVAALKGPQQCVEDMRAEYIKLRDHVVGGLRAIPGVKCTMPEGAFYAYPNVSAFFGRSGMNSASDIAANCCARRTWPRFREKASARPNTSDVSYATFRSANSTAAWSACGNSLVRFAQDGALI
jgi:aspartate aminotransferase